MGPFKRFITSAPYSKVVGVDNALNSNEFRRWSVTGPSFSDHSNMHDSIPGMAVPLRISSVLDCVGREAGYVRILC